MGDAPVSPSKPSAVLDRTKQLISAATSGVLAVTDWIGGQLHISSKWASRAGFLVLWGFGMTFIQVDEYALALLSWGLSAIVLFSKAVHWKGINGRPRATTALRIVFMVAAISFMPLSVKWTQAKRGDKPWTALKAYRPVRQRDVERRLPEQLTTKDTLEATGQQSDIRFIGGYNVNLPALQVLTIPNKFDLRWLFEEYDFSQYFRPMIDTMITANGKENKLESAIFIDVPGRSQFVGFYLPSDVDLYAVCKRLPDAAPLLVAHFASGHEFLGYGIFDKSQTRFKDLASTGRVYVYYEGFLSLPEAGDLTTLFEGKHLGLVLRGDEWLRTRIASKAQMTVHKEHTEKPQTTALAAFDGWLAGLRNQPSMSDVFQNDFPNTMKLTDGAMSVQWKDTGRTTYIKRQLYLDFPANSKFVGFYVPTSDPLDPSRTAEICLKLVQSDAVQRALDEMPRNTQILAGLAQPTTIQDLTFSGRVLIYHDDFLSVTQQADIIRAFGAKHYAVGFFGPNDFGKVLGSWDRLHGAKAATQ